MLDIFDTCLRVCCDLDVAGSIARRGRGGDKNAGSFPTLEGCGERAPSKILEVSLPLVLLYSRGKNTK